MIPLQSNHPISTLVSILFTMQWSILMYNPTPKSITQNWKECLFSFTLYSLSLVYPNNHNPPSHSKSHTDSSPAWQWETPKSDPTIDTQTNKSCHTQSIHESGSRYCRNSSTTPHVFPQPQSHHREPWRWYPQSCSNDMPSFTDDSLSTPSTPSRISHCPRYS